MTLRKLIIGSHLDFCREGAAVTNTLTGTVAVTNTTTAVVGTGTLFTTELAVGDAILLGAVAKIVAAITDNTNLTVTVANAVTSAGLTLKLVATSADDLLPGDAATANWVKVSDIEDVSAKPQIETEEVMTPSPGAYRRSAKITKSSKLDLEFTMQDLSEFAFELAFLASGAITDDFAPMSGEGMIRGWWRVTQYGQDDVQVNVMKVWGEASISDLALANSVAKPKLTLAILKNDLNEATLSL